MFGLTEEASDAEIDQAYRRLISQYHPDKFEGVAEELRRQAAERAGAGARLTIEALDVTDPTSIADAVPRLLAAAGGRLDAVVHNAGVAAAGAFEDLPESELRRVMETNFFAVLAL